MAQGKLSIRKQTQIVALFVRWQSENSVKGVNKGVLLLILDLLMRKNQMKNILLNPDNL